MKAVVFHDVGDIRVEDVEEPKLQDEYDAIVKITASAICSTDLHFIRGTAGGTAEGTILGHEGVGIVESVASGVTNFEPGDRVIIPSTIACGYCHYCRKGYFAQCDNANPNGSDGGTTFYGDPHTASGYSGMQAEKVRVPFANIGLVKIPDEVTDDQAIMLSDIFPTAYFGAKLAEVVPGSTVAIFGAGPVGQFAIKSAQLLGASRIIAVDAVPDHLKKAREQGAETINFEEQDPVEVIKQLTGGNGVDHAIDAVGVDATHPTRVPATAIAEKMSKEFEDEVESAVKKPNPKADSWKPGNTPSQASQWIVQSVAKAGYVGIVGVYPPELKHYPIGEAMHKNLTIRMGNCNHRKYIPKLLEYVRSGEVDPTQILTQTEGPEDAITAYEEFSKRSDGWLKVAIIPNL